MKTLLVSARAGMEYHVSAGASPGSVDWERVREWRDQTASDQQHDRRSRGNHLHGPGEKTMEAGGYCLMHPRLFK